MANDFQKIQDRYLQEISANLKQFVDLLYSDQYSELRDIFYYHLGLSDPVKEQGKRIRPLLTLICADGAGVSSAKAMPAAIAIELIHNFSLIHDDIEDNGEMRRGKVSVWKKWGLAQGLSAGDAMFNSAFYAIQQLNDAFSKDITTEANAQLIETCDKLTKGQFLDIRFESEPEVLDSAYFKMIEGKTAALLACSTKMGAILAGKDSTQRGFFHDFGWSLGIAFQIYDDWLGIWGDEKATGKSALSDLLEKKKSYPIILGMQASDRLRSELQHDMITEENAKKLAVHLREIGIEEQVREASRKWTKIAQDNLEQIECKKTQKELLETITYKLLMRSK
jgi:geranylgeranyl diphosphate synthase type I